MNRRRRSIPPARSSDIIIVPPPPIPLRPTDNQAIYTLDIKDAKRIFSFLDGGGIKIGTLSDSVNKRNGIPGDDIIGIDESQATGDLPPDNRIVVLSDDCCTDEGRGMMELMYDILPGATILGYATAFVSEASFANNITALRNAGMHVIVDDVTWYEEMTPTPAQLHLDTRTAVREAVGAVVDTKGEARARAPPGCGHRLR